MNNMKKKELQEEVEKLEGIISQYILVIGELNTQNNQNTSQNVQLIKLVEHYETTINLLTGRLIEGSHPLYGVGN